MTSNARAARIGAQMQRALAQLLRQGVKDPRVGNVTVTSIQVLADLSVARVYVLPFAAMHAPERAATEMLAGLHSAAGYLRGQIARELKLRQAPRLQFELDLQFDHAHQLTELIDHTLRDQRARAGETAQAGDARREDKPGDTER